MSDTPLNPALAEMLRALADKYEAASFIASDPCCFLHRYKDAKDIEAASFIAAMFAFGRRDQILDHVETVLQAAKSSSMPISEWIHSGAFSCQFKMSDKKFYRFYSHSDLLELLKDMKHLFSVSPTMGDYFKQRYKESLPCEDPLLLQELVSQAFPHSRIVPKGKTSACKRIHMFLRWMVRTHSPVDVGLWTWYSPADLIIPLDTHVLYEASRLGLFGPDAIKTPVKAGTAKNALALTRTLKQIWPNDPCKGDFALFGLGVDN